MTKEEVAEIQQRTREAWAKHQKAAEKAPRRFQPQHNDKKEECND